MHLQGSTGQLGHLTCANHKHASATQVTDFCLHQQSSSMADRCGMAANSGFAAGTLASMDRLREETGEDSTDRVGSLRCAECLGHLTQNLRFAQNHGV